MTETVDLSKRRTIPKGKKDQAVEKRLKKIRAKIEKEREKPKPIPEPVEEVLKTEYGIMKIKEGSDKLDGIREMAEDLEDYLMLEWAILYSHMSPGPYLRSIKGYSTEQAHIALLRTPSKRWFERREELQNKITESLVVRHIDIIAEVQDRHVKASNLAMAKATQMLLNGTPITDKEGNPVLNAKGEQGHRPLRSSDILNITVALKNIQDTYRKAMGFKDDEGITQIVEKIQMIQINQRGTAPDPDVETFEVVERKSVLDELTHEEITALVARARELNKK